MKLEHAAEAEAGATFSFARLCGVLLAGTTVSGNEAGAREATALIRRIVSPTRPARSKGLEFLARENYVHESVKYFMLRRRKLS